jgi:hypothetical protein
MSARTKWWTSEFLVLRLKESQQVGVYRVSLRGRRTFSIAITA